MLYDEGSRLNYSVTNYTEPYIDDPRFISLLKHRGYNHSASFGEVLKALNDWRNRYNISVYKECDRFDYCSGDFRELILAYNNIHGYVSLLVSLLKQFEGLIGTIVAADNYTK